MKVLKKTVPLWAVIVALVAVSGVAIAAVVISQQINTQIQILASYGMEVYDTDGTTLLTSVDFGSAYRDDNFFTPTDSIYYYIKNTGEADIWVSFSVTDPVSDVTIQVHTTGTTLWSGGVGDPDTISTIPLAPDQTVQFRFFIDVGPSAPFGSYTPTITFNAHDTSTG